MGIYLNDPLIVAGRIILNDPLLAPAGLTINQVNGGNPIVMGQSFSFTMTNDGGSIDSVEIIASNGVNNPLVLVLTATGSGTYSTIIPDLTQGSEDAVTDMAVTSENWDVSIKVTKGAEVSEQLINLRLPDSWLNYDLIDISPASDIGENLSVVPVNTSQAWHPDTMTIFPDGNVGANEDVQFWILHADTGLLEFITVLASELQTQANNDGPFSTDEDTPYNNIDVLANDTVASGGTLSVTAASALNGSVVINPDNTLNYSPNTNYNGADTITYDISDGIGGTDSATVPFTVGAVADLSAADDSLVVNENSVDNAGDVSTNDSTTSGGALTYAVATDVSNGSLSFNSNGTYLYSPAPDFNGADSFTYTVTDAAAGELETRTVAITVNDLSPVISGPTSITLVEGATLSRDYTITNMGTEVPTLGGADAGLFSWTNVSGYIWRLLSLAPLTAGSYAVTITGDDGVNTPVVLNVAVTVNVAPLPGVGVVEFAVTNPLRLPLRSTIH